MNTPQGILYNYWGLKSFRPLQEEIISAVLENNDAVVLMPTGGGKSLCFQVPALMLDGVTVVVSPLIALMNDQVNSLKQRGIKAEAIHSGLPFRTIERIMDDACFGNLKILYVSPERLQSGDFKVRLNTMPVSLLVIDEAHCISQWGYDFRPAYRKIAGIRNTHPKAPVIALTATATEHVLHDIIGQLDLKDPLLFKGNFLRQNLRFIVWAVEDKFISLLKLLKKIEGPKIIYVRTRRSCKELMTFISRRGYNCVMYHAGIEKEKRAEIEKAFLTDEVNIIIATNAFGMGIDKPDVRLVVHFDVPDQLESYYQEAGRAGRDGVESLAVLLHRKEDEEILFKLWDQNFPSPTYIKKVYRALGNYFRLAVGAGEGRSFPFDLIDFCDRFKLDLKLSLNALKILEQTEWILLSDPFFHPSRVQCIVDPETLYDFQMRHPKKDMVIKALLRLYEGIFHHPVPIFEKKIASFLKMEEKRLIERLQDIHQAGIIEYTRSSNTQRIIFLRERTPFKNLTIDNELLEFRKSRKKRAIRKMLDYIHSNSCRQQVILHHLGCNSNPCGSCDSCRSGYDTKNMDTEAHKIEDLIIKTLSKNALSVNQLLEFFPEGASRSVTSVLQHLYDEEIIGKSDDVVFLNEPFKDG